jgi:hypothetical protein
MSSVSGVSSTPDWVGAVAQRPPRLLLTLLGDYWWQHTEPLPSAAIVVLLAEFGVSDSAARAGSGLRRCTTGCGCRRATAPPRSSRG